MRKIVCDSIENIVKKRTKRWLPAFSCLSTMFSKGLFLRAVETGESVKNKSSSRLMTS